MTKVVIVHPSIGVYLGNCMGLGFFSMLDCAGQEHAVLLVNEVEARAHVASWDSHNNPDGYQYVEVTAADDDWVTIEELEAAGLIEFTKPMRDERLRNCEPMGRA
jgi:hypothetical protein